MLVKDLIYMIMDELKLTGSDDSFFTEEHIIFLCKKYRAFLIKKEQDKEKATTDEASVFETQQICIDLEKVPAIDGEPCTGGYYLRSTKPIPKILEGNQPRIYPIDFYQGINISYVSRDRMRYIGTNPFLRSIIFTSVGPDLHLYLNSSNPQFLYLKKLRMSAVFEDFDEVSDLLCDNDGTPQPCDVLDMEFPIRQYMVPTLIELVVNELSKGIILKEDEANNAKDDTPDVSRRR
jgi:hypothetical protein